MSGRKFPCNQCGVKCVDLCIHLVEEHMDVVESTGGNKQEIMRVFGVSKWTAERIWKLSGLYEYPKKICPRCGKEYKGNQIEHLVEEHGMVLCTARGIGLDGHQIARMLFGNWIKNGCVNTALKAIEEQEIIDMDDLFDLPKLGIVLGSDGNGGLRQMDKTDVGFGVIFADDGIG